VQPNAEGYIYYEWYVDTIELKTSFELTALGMSTGLKAVTYFTDDVSVTPATGGTNI